MNRRQLLRGLGPSGICVAGCTDIAIESEPGDEPDDREELLSVEPTAVSIEAATVERTDYELDRDTTFSLTQTIRVGDESYLVQAVNDLVEYKRTTELPPIGHEDVVRLTVVSTPEVEAFSQEVNFVEQVTAEAMGNGLQSEYEGVEIDDEPVESHTIAPFEHEVQVTKHEGRAEVEGHEVGIYIHLAETFHESDYVTMVGLYPQSLADEQGAALEMMDAVRMGRSA